MTELEQEVEEKAKPKVRKGFLVAAVLICGSMVLAAIIIPSVIRSNPRGSTTACKSNLKNMGTAMEMYSTDYDGKYPPDISYLTPNYLKTIPECPSANSMTYSLSMGKKAPYNTQSYQDYYIFQCEGENHGFLDLPPNYPQYNGIVGLIER